MLFNSWAFLLLFLPLVLGVSLRLRGQALLYWIAIASSIFYTLFGEAWFLIPMLVTTILDFYIAPRMARASSLKVKRAYLVLSICGNLGLLMYFKYSAFIIDSLHIHASWAAFFNVALPAGISFYTFQTLSYIIDVYRGHAHAEDNFPKFSSFVSFFPHLVAGPLTRHNQLLPALEKLKEEGIHPRWQEGIYLFSIGLIKKTLIADRISVIIDPVIEASAFSGGSAWLCMIGFAFQIYFDFSGYSDMAIGLGRLFDVELPQNFKSPYQAANPSDFWRRWHITLSQWLRDYLYIPLGGSRHSQARTFFALIVTMFLGGLWHGAQWTFAAWGLYHGALLIAYHIMQSAWDRWPRILQRTLTFLLVCFSWVFFRARSMDQALDWFRSLVMKSSENTWMSAGDMKKVCLYLALGLFIVNAFPPASEQGRLKNLSPVQQVGLGTLVVLGLLFMNYSSNFLYFQF